MIHRPRKRFGQNFLHDPSVVAEILAVIHPQRHEHLVEIGPGTGALTDPLLSRCDFLDAIEIDRDLAARLKIQYSGSAKLKVLCADALDVNFTDLRKSTEQLRIIGNLPYNISTPLLFHLLEQQSCIRDMHFMLQKEVVDRICAEPGSKVFGRLSVMLQFHCDAEKLFEVSSCSFRPAPKVNSAVVRLMPRPSPKYSVTDIAALKTLVGQAFSRRRKTLRNALNGYLSADEIASTGVSPSVRAETVGVADFTRLSDLYSEKNSARAG
ncbi:MAG: 16S rRNA (adenine(1518)-N(6)/adenine(1519)-N(6))-dimethyltransferase RsmA [Methylococcales bacterium]